MQGQEYYLLEKGRNILLQHYKNISIDSVTEYYDNFRGFLSYLRVKGLWFYGDPIPPQVKSALSSLAKCIKR